MPSGLRFLRGAGEFEAVHDCDASRAVFATRRVRGVETPGAVLRGRRVRTVHPAHRSPALPAHDVPQRELSHVGFARGRFLGAPRRALFGQDLAQIARQGVVARESRGRGRPDLRVLGVRPPARRVLQDRLTLARAVLAPVAVRSHVLFDPALPHVVVPPPPLSAITDSFVFRQHVTGHPFRFACLTHHVGGQAN